MTNMLRGLIALAGLMGAAGVISAAGAAHAGNASLLLPASTMLLFHACALLGTVALVERQIMHARIGLTAGFGFVLATMLFSGDLICRHLTGDRLFPFAAPIGGTLLIASWLVLTLSALWPRRS